MSAAKEEHRVRQRDAPGKYVILESSDGVEIPGATVSDVSDALDLLEAARTVQFERSSAAADRFLEVMAAADVEFITPAPVEQARRQAAHRAHLLASPVYTYQTLKDVLGHSKPSTTRTWVSRRRDEKRLFTVHVDNQVVIPAFQLDDEGTPRAALAPILKVLLSAGVDGWTLWTWLVGETPLLSGGIPSEVINTNAARVLTAATRFAARQRPAS